MVPGTRTYDSTDATKTRHLVLPTRVDYRTVKPASILRQCPFSLYRDKTCFKGSQPFAEQFKASHWKRENVHFLYSTSRGKHVHAITMHMLKHLVRSEEIGGTLEGS